MDIPEQPQVVEDVSNGYRAVLKADKHVVKRFGGRIDYNNRAWVASTYPNDMAMDAD